MKSVDNGLGKVALPIYLSIIYIYNEYIMSRKITNHINMFVMMAEHMV